MPNLVDQRASQSSSAASLRRDWTSSSAFDVGPVRLGGGQTVSSSRDG
eukprot:CAMPEP_0179922442 /NCGR_PEP_ID=MMETSP0983-20121128/5656_1 /TAXON_ID=483367 /ORGANISM="non described non described, Strain CCMP 2436" /LENGTH=47 /DNA_ID= /DNA_START= /DNA_END= /DNA_ORIENTATION=